MWHKIASRLAENFTVVATDLRGYGDSSKPQGEPDHANYSKRAMAQDQVEVMEQLGFREFYLVGHDRGARVGHRLALDYPERVKKLGILDIVSTYQMFTEADMEFGMAYYHWFFLAQPYDFPERLIGSDPEYFFRTKLAHWGKDKNAFPEEIVKEYLRCFCTPETIHASCEDYRAAATIDLVHDREDGDKKICCPLLVLWGEKGFVGKKYDVIAKWQEKAVSVTGKPVPSGHFLPEEAPEETYQALLEFLQG
jgi:haloacetate dehalogenase